MTKKIKKKDISKTITLHDSIANVKPNKSYLVCKTSPEMRDRLEKAAKINKRSMSNFVCIVVEKYLDDNEIEA